MRVWGLESINVYIDKVGFIGESFVCWVKEFGFDVVVIWVI